jgi:hypothetical protein
MKIVFDARCSLSNAIENTSSMSQMCENDYSLYKYKINIALITPSIDPISVSEG